MRNRICWIALVGTLAAGCAADFTDSSETSQAAIGPAAITTNAATYTFLSGVTVSWSGMPGASANEYVAIAPQGSPNTTITRWIVTGGAAAGMVLLEGPPTAGTYVARGFGADDSFQGESDPFVVDPAGAAMVMPNQPSYATTDPITINWSGMPGNTTDWISIAPQGSPDATTADWLYTDGGTTGSTLFMDGLAPTGYPPGPYVARAFINDSFVKIGESVVFTIGSSVTTDASMYSIDQAITVTWSGLPGNANDWIGLAPDGSSTTTVLLWVYTGGQAAGSTTFISGLPAAGTYVARAFLDNSYTLLGQSAPFTVANVVGTSIMTDATMYNVGDPVVATWMGSPGNALDWIAISPAGSADTAVTRWVYTGGQVNGSFGFEGPPAPGMYVARVYLNDRYTIIAESAIFTVQ